MRTIKKEITFEGIGLHTGEEAKITLIPTQEKGIVFEKDGIRIEATVDNVVNVYRGTSIEKNGVKIDTIEHFMAVLYAFGIDSLLIKVEGGSEVPALDGSAKIFAEKIFEVGFEGEKEKAVSITVPTKILSEDSEITYVPMDKRKLNFELFVDYKDNVIGQQRIKFELTPEKFIEEIAPARTFGFEKEIQFLKSKGLIKGANLSNAILVKEDGIANPEGLRFEDEFVRHKLLDLIGDLALSNVSLVGKVIGKKTGHKYNIKFAKKIKQNSLYYRGDVVMKVEDIKQILPHRFPFLLVDKIVELEPLKRVVGVKNVTYNETFFQGHFPGRPVMPGVLIVEAMAQTAGVMILKYVEGDYLPFFASIKDVKFRKPVEPGDTLVFEMVMDKVKGKMCKVLGKAYVDGEVVTQGEFIFGLVPKNQEEK